MSADLEVGTLAECEAVIERGLATFVEVGNALLAIRDGRLYRDSHTTFDEYCRDRWSMDRTRAHRMIAAAEVTAVLPMGNRPTSERQARELVGLEPDDAADVMRHAEVIGGGNITAVTIREARRELHNPAPAESAAEVDPYGPDLPNGEYSDLASMVDDLEDDDPPLTEEECRALADPDDLDEEPEPARITGRDGRSYPATRTRVAETAEQKRARQEREDREGQIDRTVSYLIAFVAGVPTVANFRTDPLRDEVLARFDPTTRERFLWLEKETTWPPKI